MKKFWMLALVAAFGVSACDTAPDTAEGDADAAMEEATDETPADMAMVTPALGDYNLVAIEGGDPETPFEEGDAGLLHVEESTWSFDMNGEQTANGGWSTDAGHLLVTWETGDCAGQEAVYDMVVSDTGFTQDLVESTCELAPTHLEYAMAGGDMMDDHDAMEDGEMGDGGEM